MKLSQKQLDAIRREFRLSPREVQIVDLLYEGLATNHQIGERLRTSEGAVKAAVRTLYLKTGTRSKHGAVLACLRPLGVALGDTRQAIYGRRDEDARRGAQDQP